MKTLNTGIITREKKRNGVIHIHVDSSKTDYDNYFDQMTMESECSNNTNLILEENFKIIQL